MFPSDRVLSALAGLDLGIVLLALLAFALQRWPGRARPRLARGATAALVALGALAFLAWDGFFQVRRIAGFGAGDVYHYYVGSKYAGELGYLGLYDCTVVALREEGRLRPGEVPGVRDLRNFRMGPPGAALARGRDCPQRFGAEGWERFKADVGFFDSRSGKERFWETMFRDFGYHPSPVWSLMGGSVAWLVPLDSALFPWAIRIDRLLVVALLLGIGWAFGLQAAGLAAVVWGTGVLWNYHWTGGLFLRNTWLASMILGLCFLRRGWHVTSGALLATSALLRVFPGALFASYGLHALWRTWRDRRLPRDAVRVAAGALLACLLLVPASVAYVDRGPQVYEDFAETIVLFSRNRGFNNVGLPVVAGEVARAAADVPRGTPLTRSQRAPARALRWGLAAAFAVVFVLALSRACGWEAAALGFAWIPILSMPTNYYYSFVLAAVPLAQRRRWIGVVLLLGCTAWLWDALNHWYAWESFRRALGASVVAVGLCFAVAIAMRWPQADRDAAGPSGETPYST